MRNNSRIVVDTNLWISFLISKDYTKLDEILFEKNCVLLFSEELLSEFLAVIKRPKFRKYFTEDSVEEILLTIHEFSELVEVTSPNPDICRDPKDNFLLSLCKDGNADFLISGDFDLLELEEFENTKIMSISDFLNES